MIIDPTFKESYCLQEKSEIPSRAGFVNVLSSLVLFQFTFCMFFAFFIPSWAPGFCLQDNLETCCLLFLPVMGDKWRQWVEY